ncbi:ABC transporter ATP-binding protein [Frankia sp. QA3]|uniref:ABC transporter ATP-binding protein n=1 Tax=Frankia sp. QA3 TaxID=710111 RepID=UPI000269C9E7|nr:ABC transporter ATP-binding protein [Frankia sp. QA3]EIV95120.1 spermidine/putrescine ABC transporter ATP-binding subunit [Frankia sp. QA3]
MTATGHTATGHTATGHTATGHTATGDAATGAPPAIELAGVAKDYHSRGRAVPAVSRIDLAIGPGEFFSLLGPSGCGKSTTLRMIAGFEEPTRGRILLQGRDVTAVPPNRRDVNLVFQSYALFPHLDVAGNVAFGLRRRGVKGRELRERVGTMLDLVELSELAERRPRELSGGQQQRVALARALVNRPAALLLDEPLGALDLKLRQTMQIQLKAIQREVGITFIYVTHDQGEALTMSDRIAVMNRGRVEQLASPREIYERPRTRFVAGFIGTSNLLRRTVRAVDAAGPGGRAMVVLDAGADERLSAPLHPQMGPLRTGDQVELTVRPEKIEMSATRPDGPCCALRGRIVEVVYLGTYTTYTVATHGGTEITVFWQNSTDSTNVAERGEEIWLSWLPEHSYVLPESADEEPSTPRSGGPDPGGPPEGDAPRRNGEPAAGAAAQTPTATAAHPVSP